MVREKIKESANKQKLLKFLRNGMISYHQWEWSINDDWMLMKMQHIIWQPSRLFSWKTVGGPVKSPLVTANAFTRARSVLIR